MDGLDRTLWAKARSEAILRDGDCTAADWTDIRCSPGPLNVHHINPDYADPYDVEMLICLCPRHHRIIHQLMAENDRRLKTAA